MIRALYTAASGMNATFAPRPFPAGRIGVSSQSGAVGLQTPLVRLQCPFDSGDMFGKRGDFLFEGARGGGISAQGGGVKLAFDYKGAPRPQTLALRSFVDPGKLEGFELEPISPVRRDDTVVNRAPSSTIMNAPSRFMCSDGDSRMTAITRMMPMPSDCHRSRRRRSSTCRARRSRSC